MKKFIRNRDNQIIKSIDQWKTDCPPMNKAHWVEGRSAYETAKLWVNKVPDSFLTLFGNDISSIKVYPEHKTKLDDYRGNQRNHDLFIKAQNSKNEKIIICIESKVDEPFGPTIKSKLDHAKTTSNIKERINKLLQKCFGSENSDDYKHLQYQLLTGLGGTIIECENKSNEKKVKKGYFIVQTIITPDINKNKKENNKRKFEEFISKLIEVNNKSSLPKEDQHLNSPKIIGPIKLEKSDFELYVGYIEEKYNK
jgi:citrate lyase gamma subunit